MKTNVIRTGWVILLLSLFLVQCTKTDPVTPKSSAKSLDSPTVDGIMGASSAYDAATSTYTMTIPGGTDLTAVKFTFAVPAGATAKPTSGSVQNFTNPVTYTVTAEDGSTQTFTVKMVYKSSWASSQDRYDAIRLKAQRVSGVTVSTAAPALYSVATNAAPSDAETAYIVNTADFTKYYSDPKTIAWRALDKNKLEYYSVSLTIATGELRVDKGTNITFDANGNFYSYKPYWFVIYSK